MSRRKVHPHPTFPNPHPRPATTGPEGTRARRWAAWRSPVKSPRGTDAVPALDDTRAAVFALAGSARMEIVDDLQGVEW